MTSFNVSRNNQWSGMCCMTIMLENAKHKRMTLFCWKSDLNRGQKGIPDAWKKANCCCAKPILGAASRCSTLLRPVWCVPQTMPEASQNDTPKHPRTTYLVWWTIISNFFFQPLSCFILASRTSLFPSRVSVRALVRALIQDVVSKPNSRSINADW